MVERKKDYVILICGLTGAPLENMTIVPVVNITPADNITGIPMHEPVQNIDENDSNVFEIHERLKFIEDKILEDLFIMRNELTNKYDIKDKIAVKFPKVTSFQQLMKCTEDCPILLSHLACIVGMAYFINNQICRTGNNKAVYTMKLAKVYDRNLKMGFLLRNISTDSEKWTNK
jgi:hypothetical protein